MNALCPCGCGHAMPQAQLGFDAAKALEGWMQEQGFSIAELKRKNRTPQMVEMRRQIARYLRAHRWSYPRIGEFLDRDHTTVIHLLRSKGRPELLEVV